MSDAPPVHKIPRSVLVVIHTEDLQVLLMERAAAPGFWQSVTGSLDREDEPWIETAVREVMEETGIDATMHRLVDWGTERQYEIFTRWRSRYAPGVTHNTERAFGLTLPAPVPVRLAPREHTQYVWLPYREAAEKTFSWTNRDAILELPARLDARDAKARDASVPRDPHASVPRDPHDPDALAARPAAAGSPGV